MEISYSMTSMETEKNGEKSVSDVNWRMALYDVAKSRTAHWRWECQTKSCSLQRDVERKQLKANERHQ
jgi:hypothetical protein